MNPPPVGDTPPLSPFYYLENFFKVLDFVLSHYEHLLLPEERAFHGRFSQLDRPSQCLYVRLISRKGPYFRVDKLSYDEIGDIASAGAGLIAAGFLALNAADDPGVILKLLDRKELSAFWRRLSPAEKPPSGLRKDEMVAAVGARVPAETLLAELSDWIHWYTPLHLETLLFYRLLFFGNLRQDFSEFVLSDLGLIRYESYPIRPQDRLFQNRRILEDSLALSLCSRACAELVEADETDELVRLCENLPDPGDVPHLVYRRDRIFNRVGRYFERRGEPEAALTYYGRSASPPSVERRVHLHARLGHEREVLRLCDFMIEGDYPEDGRIFARRFRDRFLKSLGRSVPAESKVRHPSSVLKLTRDPSLRIEDQVLTHYGQQGVAGFFAENRFWLNLFGLAFWDIVFAPVKDAFFNPFQRGPADLFRPEFFTVREHLILDRLEGVRPGGTWIDALLKTLETKKDTANYFVNWSRCDRRHLERFLETVPATHIKGVFERLVRSLKANSSGFPDLILFPEKGYELVEVKGPGDQLQNNQRGWLNHFHRHGMPYRVVKVVWL